MECQTAQNGGRLEGSKCMERFFQNDSNVCIFLFAFVRVDYFEKVKYNNVCLLLMVGVRRHN